MNSKKSTSLQQFQVRVDTFPELRACVLEASIYQNTLVILCGCDKEVSTIRTMVSHHWGGKLEIYRPRELMAGSMPKDDDMGANGMPINLQ
jgi:hypothetical protein